MELIDLKAEIRQGTGKSLARALRNNNAVPAVLYGAGIDPLKVSINTLDLTKLVRKHGSTGVFINLKVAGDSKEIRTVLLKEVQMDTFNLRYLHADFQEIDINKTVVVSVPVTVVGESAGVKEGGLLQIIRRELEVLCRPVNMPEAVTIDISALEIGDAVHVEELDLGEDVEIPHEVNFTILTIVPPTTATDEETIEEEEEGVVVEEEAAAEPAAEA